MTLSLSTMWAQQGRFEDLGYFRDFVAAMGFEAIEVSHSTDEVGLRRLLSSGVTVTSLHAPTPHRVMADGRRNAEANLASPDAEQARVALEETRRTIDFAAHAGIRYIVVHLGGVGDDRCDEERAVRRLYEAGETSGAAWDNARRVLSEARAAQVSAHMDVARASLESLVEYGSARGVVIGVESRLNYHEIPVPDEAVELLSPYKNDEAGFWWDIGHTEVQSRLGMIEHASWFTAVGDRIIGSHLHDVRGIVDHRGPGNGSIDWAMVASNLPEGVVRTLEIDQHEADLLVEGAAAFLEARGIV